MRYFILVIAVILFGSCKSTQDSTTQNKIVKTNTPKEKNEPKTQPLYRATTPLVWDLIHTDLDLEFDLQQEIVLGEAVLSLSPHFYNQKNIKIDAKAFDIESIKLQDPTDSLLTYTYNGLQINIEFSKTFSRNDTIKLYIKYTANPNEVIERSGKAIRGGQGLYFINGQQKINEKPTQIWTQGETDFSSCWFPTLDEPNQKTTQEVALTVPEQYKTLCNGILEFSTENGNGTRTDIWVQNKPHSPYLAMLAIGDFAVYNDTWRDIDVDYYTEHDYMDDAHAIFGTTPAMLEFYSTILGVDYPWDKYAQVVVRDFVSGAMENTSATLHGEFVQRHKEELGDYPQEGIIAHELFHQWFGDLVSCESWSNISLNEAFATYGEYLWVEHSKEPFFAQHNLEQKLNGYLKEAEVKQVDLVRFQYDSKIEVFDGHSYSKGACILHQLRTVIGDKAFFTSLNQYLTKFAHQSAEMHDLRLVVESVTGEDMNWFFNQWMFDKGHPQLSITYHLDTTTGKKFMATKQLQDLNEFPLYQIPLLVNSHQPYQTLTDTLLIRNELDTFWLKADANNLWIDFDAQNYLLAEVQEPNKSAAEWYNQLMANENYRDVHTALNALIENPTDNTLAKKAVEFGLNHPFYAIRITALNGFTTANSNNNTLLADRLMDIITTDKNSKVRSAAVELYRQNCTPKNISEFYNLLSKDSSYKVLETVVKTGIEAQDSIYLVAFCEEHASKDNEELKTAIAKAYSLFADEKKHSFFKENLYKVGAYKQARYLYSYSEFLIRTNKTTLLIDGYTVFRDVLLNTNSNWVKSSAANSLIDFYDAATEALNQAQNEQKDNPEAVGSLNNRMEDLQMRLDAIDTNIQAILATEKNKMVIERLEGR